MPVGKRVRKSRPRRKLMARRKPRVQTRGFGSDFIGGQVAKLITEVNTTDVPANVACSYLTQLSQFRRAFNVAIQYRQYRCTKVELIFEPLYNTFQESSGTGVAVAKPQLYTYLNRTQDQIYSTGTPAQQFNQLKAMGVRPRSLTRNTVISWKPNWCSVGNTIVQYNNIGSQTTPPLQTINNMYTIGNKIEWGWLSCPDTLSGASLPLLPETNLLNPYPIANEAAFVPYNGMVFFIDQQNAPTNTPVARLTMRVHWEFRGPSYYAGQFGEVPPLPVAPDLDLSGNPIVPG